MDVDGGDSMHTLTHDLVDLAILLAADKLAVLVGEFNLETYFMMERLRRVQTTIERLRMKNCYLDNIEFQEHRHRSANLML